MLVGVDGDPHPVPQPELGEDADDVTLDGDLAEVEPGDDLGVRRALGHQPHDAERREYSGPGSFMNLGGSPNFAGVQV